MDLRRICRGNRNRIKFSSKTIHYFNDPTVTVCNLGSKSQQESLEDTESSNMVNYAANIFLAIGSRGAKVRLDLNSS